jgi:DNA-binding NarL/FixJ family response regulator
MSAIARQLSGSPDNGSEPLRVVIADDHPLMLAGIRRTLERSENIEVVGEARSGPEVLDVVKRSKPEVVLLDLRMPGMSGDECIEQIRTSWPDIKVVVLSALEDSQSIDAALSAGASAYVVKSVMPADITSVIRQAASGSVFHSIARPVGARSASDPTPTEASLTDREQTILGAIAAGKTTAAIAADLWVSEHTVKFHLTNIYRKLEVPNRAAAVRYAIEHGLVEPS